MPSLSLYPKYLIPASANLRYFCAMYLKRVPAWVRALSPTDTLWAMPADTAKPCVYLSFDDGPHPIATPFILTELAKYQAKATFFCLGKNVQSFPNIYQDILAQGHAVGNHTHNHLKGWHTTTKEYLKDTLKAAKVIQSKLFRPPYGRIKRIQAKQLQERGFRLVMWSLLSGDFDRSIDGPTCLENVIFHLKPGDIVVFHDSEKAWNRMQYALPRVLDYCQQKGWEFKSI